MASAAYTRWVKAGRPLSPARPVRDIVDRMKLAYPQAADRNLFSWYSNEAHYQANPPQDHTPFSATGWPVPSPEWFVFATDIMHRPDLGVDCNVLFPYWLSEAKAGRFPSLKYIIWKAKLYSVQNKWNPESNSDHFDHIHLSIRTDYLNATLGSWSLVPGGSSDTMFFFQLEDLAAGRADGCTYQFASTGQELAAWQAKFPGVGVQRIKRAELEAGLYGVEVKKPGTVAPPAPGTGVTEDQVRVIFHQELDHVKLVSDME